ncbi:heme biosynthesis HemY N-terminal domain-containing protein [Pelistega ratti]|uniref:heme biosynthesis HemY N-terminal domain-containing protein n=1 Tax=Pelistega ratti TaxID=2652177 RepID=UPI001357BF88|nr:heme biosynthesis HemY N-terminal domain-containing protein [Pelistega ratti]
MRSLIKLLILFGLAILAVLLLKNNHDVVMIITGDERRTMSLLTAVMLLLIIFALFYIVLRLIAKVLHLPLTFSNWSEKRHEHKDIALLEQGWTDFLEGRSQQAEKHLLRLIKHTHHDKRQVLASMAAARVTHDLGNTHKRDELLAQARRISKSNPRLEAAVATVQAELLLEEGQSTAALAHLDFVEKVGQKSVHLQELMLRAYRQTGQTLKMFDIARQLHRKKILTDEEVQTLLVHYGPIYIANTSYKEAISFYQSLAREEKATTQIAMAMALRYESAEEYRKAGEVLELSLNTKIDNTILLHYAKSPEKEVGERLSFAQQLLKSDENNSNLLTALGQLCLMQKLWGQADRYLTKSLSLTENPRTYALLGILNDRQGKLQEAIRYWRLASNSFVLLDKNEEKVLVAADTSNDPAPPDVKSLAHPDEHLLVNQVEFAHDVIQEQKAPDEALFDSAPLPGVNHQTPKI